MEKPSGHDSICRALTITNVYDDEGRLGKTKGPGLSDSPYNDHGQITGTVNPLGEVATQVYDSATGELIAMVDPEGGRTTFTYSANGKRNTTTDAAGNVSTVVYDELGRVTSACVLGPHCWKN